MDDGQENRIRPRRRWAYPAWVVGDEPYVNIDYQGGAVYAKP